MGPAKIYFIFTSHIFAAIQLLGNQLVRIVAKRAFYYSAPDASKSNTVIAIVRKVTGRITRNPANLQSKCKILMQFLIQELGIR